MRLINMAEAFSPHLPDPSAPIKPSTLVAAFSFPDASSSACFVALYLLGLLPFFFFPPIGATNNQQGAMGNLRLQV
jgi:hypothetical protein